MTILPAILQPVNLYQPVFTLYAGKSNSYPGSGQTWFNTTSSPADGSAKSAYDFYLGNSSSSAGDDPTFNGTAGNQSSSEYFSFDGNDCFTIPANTTFINSLHKDGPIFTFITIMQSGSTSDGYIFGTRGGGSNEGIRLLSDNAAYINLSYVTSSGSSSTIANSTSRVLINPIFIAVSWNGVTGSGNIRTINTISGDESTSFTKIHNPGLTGSADRLTIGGRGPNEGELPSGSKMWFVGMWNTALTYTQITNIYNRTRRLAGI